MSSLVTSSPQLRGDSTTKYVYNIQIKNEREYSKHEARDGKKER